MSKTKPPGRIPPASHEKFLTLLETLPGAWLVVDDADTIVYANACVQAVLGVTREKICGQPLWRGAPQLVSPSLYQAVQKTKQTREPTNVAYVSSVTNTWLHVSLSPTEEGLALWFQEPPPLQDASSRNEQTYRDLLESFADGVTIVTPNGLVLDINQRPLAAARLRREEVVGKPLTDLPAWSSDPVVQEHLRAAIARASRGETVRFEARIHPRTDLFLDILMTITSHRDANQQVAYLICAGRDITARKRAEDELRTLVDAIPQLVWMMRPDGSCDYCNRRWCTYTNMTSEQAQGDGWFQAIHPDDQPRTLEMWQRAVQTGMPYEIEQRLRDGTTGAYRWFLARAMPHKDDQGTTLKWFGTSTDIDEQKRAEQQFKESEENWHVLAETVPQFVWIERADGSVEYLNHRYIDYLQAKPEQLQSSGWSHFLHADDSQRTMVAWRQACDSGEPYEIEYRLREGQTGAYRWFLARAMPVRDETGQIVKWFGTCTDIDEQKRIEEALRQSQERIRALINSNIIGIVSVEGEEDVLVEANEAYLHMTGYTPEDVRSGTLSVESTTSLEQVPLFKRALQEVAARGQHTPFETELVCKDGSRLPVLVGSVIFGERPRQIISFVLDNSARQELEQRKDAFISMASHELRNPLTALKLQMSLLHRQLAKQSALASTPALSRMETQINTVTRLVEGLLDVSKMQAGGLEYVRETVDLDALLWEITETLQQTSSSHTLVVHGSVGTSVIGDRDRLGQVFINLISNAIKYSPDAETVEMDLSASKDAITVSVRDHGLGIPREQCDKIFDRFYRVAGLRQKAISGLGMGLYIVAEIVKHHGGTITVDSTVGKGSTFTVSLPRRRDA